jgi:hypothetical protein
MSMKRTLAVLAVLLFSPVNVKLQEHAPTADVCRADAAVWGNSQARIDYFNAETAKHTDSTPNRTLIEELPIKEVKARIREMYACFDVDPSKKDF